jgi:hypothetical protein
VAAISELLFASRARRIVDARPSAQHAVVRRWWRAARARLRVAERLDPQTELLAALVLYREGAIALIGAAIAAVEGEVTTADVADIDTAWSALERIWMKLDTGVDLAALGDTREALREQDALDAAPPPIARSKAMCRGIDHWVALVEQAIEPRTARQLAWSRIVRVAPLVVVPLAVLAWVVPPLFEPKSLTLNKPVTVSSSRESEAPPGGHDVVNGKIEHTFGMQTNEEENPWVVVDLEQPTLVHRIVVYNRGDGWFTDCLPLILEVGVDKSSLHVVATRETLFSQRRPWEIELGDTIRFIRLSKKRGYITLAEIAAY